MQFSAVEIRFIVTIYFYSTFANDLKRKYFFSKNVHSYRVCSFKVVAFTVSEKSSNIYLWQCHTSFVYYGTEMEQKSDVNCEVKS